MNNTKPKEKYIKNFNEFEKSLNGEADSVLHRIRKNAIEAFDRMDFPTLKNEDWKYTNISPILENNFISIKDTAGSESFKAKIEDHLIKDLNVILLVFINGVYSKELSKIPDLYGGVKIGSFAESARKDPALFNEHFAKYAKLENGFIALNTAFAQDGAFIYIPDNYVLENPVHILNLLGTRGANILSQPRNLIIAGKSSRLCMIESYHNIENEINFTNVVTEISAGENSNIEFYKIQDESSHAYHISKTQVEQKKNSKFTSYTVTTGGGLVRNDLNTLLNAEGCEAHFFGIYIGDGKQHIDNHTMIDHAKPRCLSNELYKGVMDDGSRAVFNGKVYVRPDAQKTNAYQSNKNILLSKEAHVDTKPQLEIYADDVRCTHGATVGQLDEESVFYLRSRGISKENAVSVLIRAFANDIFEEIKTEQLKEHLNNMIFRKLKEIV
jgi:Fe-S cluster assembly protein SufD